MTPFNLTHFDDFLTIAGQHSEPQALILVITRRELPDPCTAQQKREFEQGQGGNLIPIAGVDRRPQDLSGFSDFSEQAAHISSDWDTVFVAALPGQGVNQPSPSAVDEAVEKVTHAIRNGMINNLLAFNRQGEPLVLNQSG